MPWTDEKAMDVRDINQVALRDSLAIRSGEEAKERYYG